jgi:cytochrome c-type biogenesis protein CcmE
MKSRVFFSVVLAVFATALFGIVLSTTSTTANVLTPMEIVESDLRNAARIRVVGRVAEGQFNYSVKPFKLVFFVTDRLDKSKEKKGDQSDENTAKINDKAKIKVIYENIKPDMFGPNRDVLIDGELIDKQLFATSVLTQCPSKYEPEDPKNRYAKKGV